MKKKYLVAFLFLALGAALLFIACGGDDDDDSGGDDESACPDPTIDISVCDPETGGPFSLTIDNEWYPLEVGMLLVLEGEDEGESVRVEIEVLDQIETVAGVETRVVTETEYVDGELDEVSWNWFAQAPDGTVCYFGEKVDSYEDGELVESEGEWRAGEDGAQAGIIMPADPQVGDAYYQEYLVEEAEDIGEINDFGEAIDVPAGAFDDTMTVLDYDPLEDCEGEKKVYVRGIGIVIDEAAELTSF